MDRADRIIKINESLQKVQLNEAIPLIGLALNALKMGVSKVGGGILNAGNKGLNLLSGGNRFARQNLIGNMISGAGAGGQASTTPGAPQDSIGQSHMGDESEGTPGQNRPNKII